MKNKIMAAAAFSACALAWAAKDPVVMTVGKIEVPKSEFEYLYHKNSQQQVQAQPLDEYAEMFAVYKLKVADALAEGLDTTASFRREMAQYRRDLGAPYMNDSVYLMSLVQEAYDRSQSEVEVSHIMVMKSPDAAANRAGRQMLDSLRAVLVAGGDFAEAAARHSQDRGSMSRGGYLGYIAGERLPYSFETAAYGLEDNELSQVVESPMGYHLIKRGHSRPARGTVLASHIMKMVPPTATAAEDAAARAWADSIYDVVSANPSLFETIAVNESDDKGSGRQGGKLPWFGAGMMVAPFDSAAFSLKTGEISRPVRTQYGWHIIRKLDAKGPATLDELKPEVLAHIANPQDERYTMVRRHNTERLAKKFKASLDQNGLETLRQYVRANGLDSAFYAECRSGSLADVRVATKGKTPLTAAMMVDGMRESRQPDGERAAEMIDSFADYFMTRAMEQAEYDWLEANVPEYGNLLREYRDGSLLYEVSVAKVWDRASKDTEGLARYFEQHRGDYTWQKPHVKGYLVQAANDSVARAVNAAMSVMGGDTIVPAVRREFGKQVVIESVLVEQGANPMVDNIVFGAPAVRPSAAAMTTYFMYDPRVLDAPEEVSDVRGLVTSDYQTELERQWVEDLKSRYPVTVNQKVLKKIK